MDIPSDFTHMLHFLRTQQLQDTAPANGTMVSVGCNGLQYFDWIDENLGKPARHIGLEFYMEEPAGLPDHVLWIANTAGDMRDVPSNSVDLVFAGQTIEHLWHQELAGFFAESARVLKTGGRLLFDSPNREISNALMWNHPEHTVELVSEEAAEMARIAGFEVIKSVGHWLCRDQDTGALLPLTDITEVGEWPAERRIREGIDQPRDCFSWWLEAKRTAREPDFVELYKRARDFSQLHFAARIDKMMQSQIAEKHLRQFRAWATAPSGWSGALVFGPHAPLPPGDWLIRFHIDPYIATTSPGIAEVFQTPTGEKLIARDLPARLDDSFVDLRIKLDDTHFGLEFRLWSNGAIPMTAMIGVELFHEGIG